MYDSLGRKIQLEDPDVGTYYYRYDLTGNLVQQVGGGGNLITGDGYYREYNELNQLIRIRNGSNSTGNILEEHTYDPNGDRIKIKRFDAANTTIYTPYREWTQIRNSSGTYDFTYIYDGSILVARINPDGSKHYFHDDHLGSVSLITNQSGAIIEQTFFEPFGSVMAGGTAEDKLYTGQFSDELTNQYYYGARYYIHSRGQFGQPDSVIANVYDPQSLNRYSYVLNNPYKYIDPTGKEPVKDEAGTRNQAKEGEDKVIKKLKDEAAKSNKKLTAQEINKKLAEYYRSQYKRDNTPRYIYTTQKGWIDLYHYYSAASLSSRVGAGNTRDAGYIVELAQGISAIFTLFGKKGQEDSFFAIDDIPSNSAGTVQGEATKAMSADEARAYIEQQFEEMGATNPTNDPAYNRLNDAYSNSYSDRAYKVPWIFPFKVPGWWP